MCRRFDSVHHHHKKPLGTPRGFFISIVLQNILILGEANTKLVTTQMWLPIKNPAHRPGFQNNAERLISVLKNQLFTSVEVNNLLSLGSKVFILSSIAFYRCGILLYEYSSLYFNVVRRVNENIITLI